MVTRIDRRRLAGTGVAEPHAGPLLDVLDELVDVANQGGAGPAGPQGEPGPPGPPGEPFPPLDAASVDVAYAAEPASPAVYALPAGIGRFATLNRDGGGVVPTSTGAAILLDNGGVGDGVPVLVKGGVLVSDCTAYGGFDLEIACSDGRILPVTHDGSPGTVALHCSGTAFEAALPGEADVQVPLSTTRALRME